tara:strand:+ start:95 stop:556 length:462 start_codon:yes stop_codon:yes gene_type:complete
MAKKTYKRSGKEISLSENHGRPTKYKPEYDAMLLDHYKKGYSFESFVWHVDCDPATLYEWAKLHPSFNEAKRRGEALGRYFWENLGKGGASGQVPGFNSTAWVFMMKNRYNYHDNVRVQTVADPEDKSKDEQIKKLSEHLAVLKELANGLEQV